MEKFKEFKINNMEFIYGGKLIETYVGRNGDFWDTERERFIIIL